MNIMSLDRTPLDAAEILLTGISMPPSANNCFFNLPNGGRARSKRYDTWRNAAGWEIKLQRQPSIKGPVNITYTYEDGGTRADLGNLEKAPTDLLVHLCLIEGDGPKVVRSIKLQWGAVEGLQIEVRKAA
jgi:Holliday junction resolvase RusA-like endonuclease